MLQISDDDKLWAEKIWEKITLKMSVLCDRLGALIPYSAANGRYTERMKNNETDINWWTNGFWPGMLWLMYNETKEEKYLTTARLIEEKLDAALCGFEGLHHDVGFMWTHASVLDWRITGDKIARKRALHAATILAGRYNPRGKFIRSWNDPPAQFAVNTPAGYRDGAGWIIVDCMMNLSLLYWAGGQTGDPRFAFIANDHADTALKNLVREDGSCNHIAVLDPQNGALIETPAGQGYASGSSWTRGQAWALHGFSFTFRNSGEKRYLDAARRITNYFCSEISRYGYIPPSDFRAPREPEIIDTSAGSIAACGLLELSNSVCANSVCENSVISKEEAENYKKDAISIIKAIEAAHCDWDVSSDGIVKMATAQYHDKLEERHLPIIYGDYFFMEAINRLRGSNFQIW